MMPSRDTSSNGRESSSRNRRRVRDDERRCLWMDKDWYQQQLYSLSVHTSSHSPSFVTPSSVVTKYLYRETLELLLISPSRREGVLRWIQHLSSHHQYLITLSVVPPSFVLMVTLSILVIMWIDLAGQMSVKISGLIPYYVRHQHHPSVFCW